jgi:predicted nucleotidyltransferase component of viral defense system
MAKPVRDVGASVRARLLNLAREKNQAMDLLLTRYAIERLLYRLSISKRAERFILKGAVLVTSWFDEPHRPTRDVDLLGFGDAAPEAMLDVFAELAQVAADDGLTFDTASLRVDLIREHLDYGGVRLRINATLAGARIPVVIDVAFGDALEPGAEEVDLPVLLDFPRPHLRAYARETVIAEKFQAMVALGLANTRMKDYYDIWMLSRMHEFTADRMVSALTATFARRGTEIPTGVPEGLSAAFAGSLGKQAQWAAFVRDLAVVAPSLEVVCADIGAFLTPYMTAVVNRA